MYIPKVWLTTVTVSPIILSIAEGFMNFNSCGSVYTSIQLLVVMMLCSLVFSAPTIIAQYLLLVLLENSQTSNYIVKVSISALTIFGVFLSFYIVDSNSFSFKNNFLFWPLTYAAIMTASIWIYKLEPSSQKYKNEQ